MSTTEDTRRELFDTVAAHLGRPAAEQLMAITIPANTDLATREDLDLLRADLELLRAEMRAEMSELRAELRTEVSELQADMAELRAEMLIRIEALEGRMTGLEARMEALEARMKDLASAFERSLTGAVELLRTERSRDLEKLRSDFLWKAVPLFAGIVTAIVGIAGLLS